MSVIPQLHGRRRAGYSCSREGLSNGGCKHQADGGGFGQTRLPVLLRTHYDEQLVHTTVRLDTAAGNTFLQGRLLPQFRHYCEGLPHCRELLFWDQDGDPHCAAERLPHLRCCAVALIDDRSTV